MKTTALQMRDTCMAITLLLLLVYYFTKNTIFISVAILFLLLGMIIPSSMKPFAIFWFGLAEVLGKVVSSILLAIVFILIVTPVALVRQAMGKDQLSLKKWKKSNDSCFITRDYTYSAKDFDKTY